MGAFLAWRDEDHEQPPFPFGTFSREAGEGTYAGRARTSAMLFASAKFWHPLSW